MTFATDKTLTFVNYHIPRTGGRTRTKVLSGIFPPDAVFSSMGDNKRSRDEYLRLDDEGKGQFRLIAGHMPFAFLKAIRAPRFVTTFFRHPIKRCISQYEAIKSWKDHPVSIQVNENGMSIGDYFLSGLKDTVYDNSLVRSFLEEAPPNGGIGESHLARALRNFEDTIDFVGRMEDMKRSFELLAAQTGLPIDTDDIPTVGKLADDRKILSIPPEDLEILKHVTRYDFVLYEHGMNIYSSYSL